MVMFIFPGNIRYRANQATGFAGCNDLPRGPCTLAQRVENHTFKIVTERAASLKPTVPPAF